MPPKKTSKTTTQSPNKSSRKNTSDKDKAAVKGKKKNDPKGVINSPESPEFTSGEVIHNTVVEQSCAPNADDYSKLSQRDHIYTVTDTYVGSDEHNPREEYLLDLANMSAYRQVVEIPEAVDRLFIEILSNAGDNVERSLRSKVDPGQINITMNKKTIKIRNGGVPIPIEKHKKEKIYVPELIFGNLLTSSNYDKTKVRLGCGRNGYGAKLVNVFSKKFELTVCDGKLLYTQKWSDNMGTCNEPVIEQADGIAPFVEIVYEMDFPRFKYTEYPDEAIALFARYAADMSLTCKTPVTFNDKLLDFRKMEDYVRLYFELPETPPVYHIERSSDSKQLPMVEMCVIDTPYAGGCLSFANGIMTIDGGVHVEAAYKAISNSILDHINNGGGRDPNGKNKAKNKVASNVKLSISDIKPHIVIVLSCRLPDVKFKGQTKTVLASPTPNFTIDNRMIKTMMKWKLVDRLYATLDSKQDNLLSKSDGKKRKFVKLDKGKDANEAGGPKSMECSLMIVEGDSAAAYAETLMGILEDGYDFYGYYPVRGKFINMKNAPKDKIANNKEYCGLKKMLGVREGVDYAPNEIFSQLRYGKVYLLADSDVDGTHITGLIETMFDERFESLIRRGFLVILKTPILRVHKGKTIHKFYTQGEYENWKSSNNYKQWSHKYYKGLGTSAEEDIRDDAKCQKLVSVRYDDNAKEMLDMAFDNTRSSDRKIWIEQYRPNRTIERVPDVQDVSDFIKDEYIEYIIANLIRAIPRAEDGLKESQRKILWSAFLKWSSEGKPEKGLKKSLHEMKVAQLANYAAEQTDYHHGENNLAETIIAMAADYQGTLNMNYFKPKGQFGNRHGGNKAAANARYLFTYPEWWIPYVYRPEDFPLYEKNIDSDGNDIEPVTFSPIICMALINGTSGIAVGWSTFIPCHNPLDIVRWIQNKIVGKTTPALVPWYRGFKGMIKIIDKQPGKQTTLETEELDVEHNNILSDDEDNNDDKDTYHIDDDTNFVDRHTKRTMYTEGVFTVLPKGDIHITELPIGRWTNGYISYIQDKIEEGALKSYREKSTTRDVHLILQNVRTLSDKQLKLSKCFGMSNMVLLNEENKPVKYDTAEMIMEVFYKKRLALYEKRRQYLISNLKEQIKHLNLKKKFIQLVIDDKLIVFKRSKDDIYKDMDKHSLPHELLGRTNLSHLSKDDIQELAEEIETLELKVVELNKTTASIMWMKDLNEFVQEYCKVYKCRYTPPKFST